MKFALFSMLSSAPNSALRPHSISANAAYRGMVARYGILQSSVGKGSCDYNAVRQASVEDLYYAIEGGGLGSLKSAEINAILDLVYEENQQSQKESITAQEAGNALATLKVSESGNGASRFREIDPTDHDNLSLNHCYTLSTGDAMPKFRTYPGIGVKTAACVALFCLQRPCFAVDTHVFRLCQWAWLDSASRSEAEGTESRKQRYDVFTSRGQGTRLFEVYAIPALPGLW